MLKNKNVLILSIMFLISMSNLGFMYFFIGFSYQSIFLYTVFGAIFSISFIFLLFSLISYLVDKS